MNRDSLDTRFFGHPAGLSTLFFTELWERFGYYGMRAILVLFMTAAAASGGLGLDPARAYAIYGLYTASVYMASLPGGWIADRILGQQRAVLLGGLLIAAGYLTLAVPSGAAFFLGLATVVAGSGLLKPNISTIVGQLYAPADARRESGFSIFYMGIN
ncbi:MAG: oligopeptide:H+ symporter, partial [Bryobacteraceae bacterium]